MHESDRTALRKSLAILGFVVFAVALGLALHRAAPGVAEINAGWLLPMFLAVFVSLAVQMEQIIVFLRSRGGQESRRWAAWFAAEKAWINVAIPAKAGTIGAVAVMAKRHGLPWTEYAAFMLLSGLLTAAASLGGALFLFLDLPVAVGACLMIGLLLVALPHLPGDRGRVSRIYLITLAVVNLMAISLGLVFALMVLGIAGEFTELFPAGIALNLLSLASLTPGNFGVREVVLAAMAPLLAVPISELILSAAMFVIGRLGLAFLLATALRGAAWLPPK